MKPFIVKVVAASMLLSILLAACAAIPAPTPSDPVWERIQGNQKIVVGVSMDYPPYEYVDQNFVAAGFDIGLIEELSKQLGLPMDVKNYAFEGLGDALQTGDIDIAISAIAVTPEREETYSFSTVYLSDTSAAVTLPTSSIVIVTPEQLAAYRVGVQRGSVYETELQDLLVDTGLMPAARLYSYITPDDALSALAENLIDVFVLDKGSAEVYVETNNLRLAGQGTDPHLYAVAMPKDTPVLLENINAALLALLNDGTIARLSLEYLGYDSSALPPGCVDGMAFVADVTYPDKNMTAPPEVTPGQSFVKTWRVKNTGACSWVSGYQLVFAYGNTPAASMSGKPVPITSPVAPGTTKDLSAALIAPTAPGTYQGFWQMVNDHGTPFGQTIWVGIKVVDPAKPTPAPIPAPSITSFTVSPSSINLGGCVTASWTISGTVDNVVFERDGQDLLRRGPASGQFQDCPPSAGTVNYALGAYGPGGQDVKQINVTVNQAAATAAPPTAVPPTAVPPTPVPVNPLVGPTWELLTLDNASVDPSYGIELTFNSDGTVEGFDGCVNFTGDYRTSGGQIDFSGYVPETTVSNCLPDAADISTAYKLALSEVTNFSISGTTLNMTDASGTQRLQYKEAR
jgi:polar amino acid transport system substrate-binding protein